MFFLLNKLIKALFKQYLCIKTTIHLIKSHRPSMQSYFFFREQSRERTFRFIPIIPSITITFPSLRNIVTHMNTHKGKTKARKFIYILFIKST